MPSLRMCFGKTRKRYDINYLSVGPFYIMCQITYDSSRRFAMNVAFHPRFFVKSGKSTESPIRFKVNFFIGMK